MRRAFFTTIATAAGAAAAVAMGSAPAALASSGPTSTTFTILSSGSLSITTPTTANLGEANTTEGTLANTLGDVTVTDATTPDNGSWTTTVEISSPFTIGNGLGSTTTPDANVSYAPGDCTPGGPGTGTFTPGDGGAMSASQTAMDASALFGDTTCTWDPTITVTLDGSPAGVYKGTILHSVTAGTGT